MSDTPFSAPSPESMNSLLPGFGFTAKVSANAHGAVYFANQKSLDRQVAIKLLSPESLDGFESKARIAAGLKHPNLISIFDSGIVEGMPYIVMEFVPGKSLAHSTKGQAIEFEQAMSLIEAICNGLGYAHEHGVMHGHFDSSNVLLNQKAEPKIGNFGLQHSARGEADDVQAGYVAPEVLADPATLSARSDIYSIAAVFYELIAGRRHGPDVPPPSAIIKCSPEIDAVLKQATDANPEKRMADVNAFHTALKQAADAGGKVKLKAAENTPAPVTSLMGQASTGRRKVYIGKVGFDWMLLRNLAIIAGLVYGICIAWQLMGMVRESRDKESQRILAKQAADKAIAEAAHKRDVELAKLKSGPGSVTTPVIPQRPREKETPMESLDRLSSRLASGSRSEMPIGCVSKGQSDYFLVSKPMTWADAASFAEEHGGHLAVPDSEADPAWLSSELAKHAAAWIGVARGGDSWVQADGGTWDSKWANTGNGQHISLDNGKLIAADGSALKLPFIIQWHRDGSNPGKLTLLLDAAAKSIAKSTPYFPPSTVSFGSRNYLYVSRHVGWNQAKDLAESAGGNLLVVSDAEEASNLKAITSRLDKDGRIWLGGFIVGNLWTWVTGEPWVIADWMENATESEGSSALCVRPGKGWDAQDRDVAASGFIIEWSADPKNSAGKAKGGGLGEDSAALLARAKEVVLAADKKHRDAIVANSKKFTWDLDGYLRGLSKGGQAQWAPHVMRLKSCVDNDRLQVEAMRSGEIRYSAEMLKLGNYHVDKQAEIDKQFASSAAAIRDAFVSKLKEFKDKAQELGQLKLAEDTEESIDDASDLDRWLDLFGIDLPPVAGN